MKEFSWLNFISVPAFALDVLSEDNANIVFWNEAMEELSDVSSEQAVSGRLPSFGRRLMTAVNRGSKSAYLGSLGKFSFKVTLQGQVIATLIEKSEQACDDERALFLTMAAHDLRAPLRQIRHLVDAIREDFQDLGDGKLDMLTLICDIGERAHVLTNDVIAHTRATQAHPEMIEGVDLCEVANDVFATIDPLRKHMLSSAPVILETDKIALQITLRNLLDNAVRHGGTEKIEIAVAVETTASEGALKFTVTDNGNGFEAPATVFLSGGDFHSGSSFGLLGVRRLIEARGGEIIARPPQNGSGSEVSFSLPGWILPERRGGARTGYDVIS